MTLTIEGRESDAYWQISHFFRDLSSRIDWLHWTSFIAGQNARVSRSYQTKAQAQGQGQGQGQGEEGQIRGSMDFKEGVRWQLMLKNKWLKWDQCENSKNWDIQWKGGDRGTELRWSQTTPPCWLHLASEILRRSRPSTTQGGSHFQQIDNLLYIVKCSILAIHLSDFDSFCWQFALEGRRQFLLLLRPVSSQWLESQVI